MATSRKAIQLAEHWHDMKALVDLDLDAERKLTKRIQHDPEPHKGGSKHYEHEFRNIQRRTERYFDRYGSDWATAYFNKMVIQGKLGSLLVEGQTDEKKQQYLTQFLRKNPGYQKISWINDIICEQDPSQASDTLDSLARKKRDDLWTKKTELSLGKLAHLASAERDSKTLANKSKLSTKQFDDRIALLDLQDRLQKHVMPHTGGAVDSAAAQQLALETFRQKVVGKKKYLALKALLNDGLGLLLENKTVPAERLVDVLTLMDDVTYVGSDEEDPQIFQHELWLALTVLRLDEMEATMAEGLNHVIWRRAMIRDDWISLNNTTDKNDQLITTAMTQTCLFRTLVDCFAHVQQNVGEATNIRLLSPLQILNADIFPKSLQKRFRENEVELVQRDLKAENEVLKKYVEKGRVELHYGGLLKMAQAEVRARADEAGNQVAREAARG